MDGKGILEVNFDDIAPLAKMAKARFDAMAESRKATFAEWSHLCQQYSPFADRERAARIEQRRRQWDLEASQSIKE